MPDLADFTWLPVAMRTEMAELSRRFGTPVTSSADLGSSSYLRRVVESRFAEVCMVVCRPSGRMLAFRKPFYPAGIFRLLTGGIEDGESIREALLREVHEETGLNVTIARFLAASSYATDGQPRFASFAFLLREAGGTLGALDADEQVESFREIEAPELLAIAERLEQLPSTHNATLDADVREWGQLRALNHRLVYHALRQWESE